MGAGSLCSFLQASPAASSPRLPWLNLSQRSWQLACPTEVDTALEAFAVLEPKSPALSRSYVLAFHCKKQAVVLKLGQLLLIIN